MANLSFLNGLGAVGQGYYQGVDERMRRQYLQSQMAQQEQQQKGLAALANAYGSMPPPQQQQQPMPTPPMPGQPSQPQGGPPGGGMPPPPQGMGQPQPRPQPQPQMPPGMMPGRQMGPPQQQMGPPPQQQAQPKPYTAPQAPQQPQQPPGGGQAMIPPPPQVTQAVQQALPDLETMASTLKKQGITGMALMAALQQHQQFLSQDGKQQLAALTAEVKKMQAEAAGVRAGAAATTAGTGVDREKRMEGREEGTTARGAADLELKRSQVDKNEAQARKAAAVKAQGKSGGNLPDDLLNDLARQLNAGDKSVLTNLGRGAQGSENIIALRARAAQLNRTGGVSPESQAATNAEYAGTTAGERTLGTRSANVGMAVSEASKFAQLALDASKAVERTRYPSINKLLMAAEQGSGDEAVVRFAAAHNSLINAYARAVSPTGSPTVSDKEHAREMLDKAYSTGQYAAAVDQLQKEMAAAKQAPGEVRQELRSAVTGGKGERAMSDLDKQALAWAKANPNAPQSKQILQRLGM